MPQGTGQHPRTRHPVRSRSIADSVRSFYALCFDGPDDSLTAQDFCKLLSEFNLLKYAEHLALLQAQFHSPGSA